MDQPKNTPGTLAAEQVAAEPYTERGHGTRAATNAVRGKAMTDRRPLLERALVPALLSGMLVVAGSFAVQVSMEMGAIQRQLGELRGRLDGVDQRFDGVDQRFDGVDQRFDRVDQRLDRVDQRLDRMDQRLDGLRADMNDRLGRIEALLLAQRDLRSGPGR